MHIRLLLWGLAVVMAFSWTGCSKLVKLKNKDVEIEFRTPQGFKGRGVGEVHILRDRSVLTNDRYVECKGEVAPENYVELIRRLNKMGIIFMKSDPIQFKDKDAVFSLRVAEYKGEDIRRTNTVYWEVPDKSFQDILLRLHWIRRKVVLGGECYGILGNGAECMHHHQCRSECCYPVTKTKQICQMKEDCADLNAKVPRPKEEVGSVDVQIGPDSVAAKP